MKIKSNPFIVIAATLLAQPIADAATWTGATNASWATAGNWTGTPPDNLTAQAIVYDSASTANLTQTLNGSYAVTGISVGSPTAAVVVNTGTGTNTLTLGAGGIDLSAATQNLTLNVSTTVGSANNWTVASGRTLTTGAGGSTLALNNAPTLDGAGIVFIGGASGSTTLTGSANLNINNGRLAWGTQSGSSVVGYSGRFVLNSGGKLSINTSNTLPALTINGGSIGSFNTSNRTESGALTIGGDFTIGGSEAAGTVGNISTGRVMFTGAVDLNAGTRTITLFNSSCFGGFSTGSVTNGNLIKSGAGGLVLGASVNMTTVGLDIQAGAVKLADGAVSIGSLSGITGTSIDSNYNLVSDNARTLNVNQTTDGTYAGIISNAGGATRKISLVKGGSAKLTLSGANTYDGGTTISQGTLAAITNGTALGSSGTVTINDTNTGSANTALLLGNITMGRAVTVANQGSGTTTLGANAGAALPTFSGAITLAKDVILDGTGNTDRLTFSGGIGGTGNVTVSGGTNRVVFMTTANSYSGTTTVNANSILQLGGGGSAAVSFIPDSSVVTVNNGGFLKLAKGANSETIGGLSGSGTVRGHEGVTNVTSELIIDGGASQNFSGVLENGGASGSKLSLTKTVAAGTQTLSGVNTYTGATTVNGGTLALGAGGSIANSSPISLAAAGTLDVSAATFTLGTSQTLSGSGTVIGTVGNGALGGVITASGGNLSIGSLAYSGDGIVNVTPGFAIVNVTDTDGLSTSPDPVTINVQGGALTPGQYPVIDYTGSIQGSGVDSFVVGSTPGGAYSYSLVNNAANSSVDLVVASLADVWSGAFSGEWSSASIGGSKNWTLNGSPADYAEAHDVQFTDAATGTTAVDVSVADVSPASVSFNNSSKNYTLQGSAGIAGSTGLTKVGTGSLTISNVNKFTGSVNIGGGTVSVASVANGGVDSPLGAGIDVSLGNGTLSYTGPTASTDRYLTLTAPGTLEVTASGATLTLTGSVVGGSSLTKAGAGVLEIGGSSASFTGATQIDGGTLRISDGGTWGTGGIVNNSTLEVNRSTALALANVVSGTGSLVKNGGGTLTLSGANSYAGGTIITGGQLNIGTGSTASAGTGAISIAPGSTLGLTWTSTGVIVLPNSLTGSGTVVQAGGSQSTLTGNNTFSGVYQINGGTLAFRSVTSAAGEPKVAIAAGANMSLGNDFAGQTCTISELSGAGGVNPQFDAAAGTKTLEVKQSTDTTLSGVMRDATSGARFLALTKSGSGKLTLSGANTYTGATRVNGGTLAVTGTLANTPVTVKTGGTLAGSGNLGGSVTIETGGTHALEVAASPGAQVTRTITGALDLSAVGDILSLTAAATPSDGTYILATATGGITGVPESVIQSGVTGTFSVNGNNLELTVSSGGYAAWKTANGTTQTIDQDHDGDGVSNGVEFFFGGPNSTTGFTPQPGITGTSVTYSKHSGYTGVYGTDFVIETSETLSGAWFQETVGGNVVQSGDRFTYTFPAPLGAKKFVRLKVTGPQ